MTITAREFTSGAEMRAHAAAVRRRLFHPPVFKSPKPVAKVLQMPEPKPDPAPEANILPAWQVYDLHFDKHVIESRLILLMVKNHEIEFSRFGRRTIHQIVTDVLQEFPDVTIPQIQGASRTREIVWPRQLAMAAVKDERPDLSLPVIGRWFGGRDHTTVLHAIRKVHETRGRA